MAKVTIRATNHFHSSDGYKKPGESWEVSQEEADALIKSRHPVELFTPTKVKEEKAPLETKEEKAPVATKGKGAKTITTGNLKKEE